MKHYGLTRKQMVKKLQEAGIAGDLDEKADRANRKMLLLGRVRSSGKSPRFPVGPMLKNKKKPSKNGVTIVRGAPKMFDGKVYTNKAERKALKRAKVAQINDLMARVDEFVEEYGYE